MAKGTGWGLAGKWKPVPDESWNQQVNVFICHKWRGEPQTTDEIKPQWFQISELPLDAMGGDARYWLPQLLAGQRFTGDFLFDANLKVVEYKYIPTVSKMR